MKKRFNFLADRMIPLKDLVSQLVRIDYLSRAEIF